MFEDPHMIYLIARQKHAELLAELENIQRVKASSKSMDKRKSRWIARIILPIAELLIAMGAGLKRRCGQRVEEAED